MKCKKCGYELERDTKFCPNCGQETSRKCCYYCGQDLDDDTKFCPNCGKPVVGETQKMVCSTCGQILEEGTVFCTNCGNKVEKADTPKNPTDISTEEQTVETNENAVKQETSSSAETTEAKVTMEKETINNQLNPEIPIQPVQSTVQDAKKSFWKNPILWIVSISLLVICLLISLYFQSLPTKKTTNNSANTPSTTEKDKEVKDVSTLKIKGTNTAFVNQTNTNIGGYTYIFDNKLYVSTSDGIYRYDLDYSNEEEMLDESGTCLYVDEEFIYYCDYVNNFIRYNIATKESETLLEDVYYVQVIDRNIYYQSNQDNESIYVYNLDSKENKKLNDTPSYTITVDTENNSIYYINDNATLCKINLDGSDNQEIVEDVTDYTIYKGNLYCVNEKGIEAYDIATKKSTKLLKKSSIKNINILNNRLVYSVYYDGIYSVDLKGENRKILVDQKVSSFEVQGDKIIFDCNNDYTYQVVDNKGNYGKLPTIKSRLYDGYDDYDDEDDDMNGTHSF